MLERSRFAEAKTVAIRLSPPPEGGGETLFQPVGKALLEAKKRGWIDRLQTLAGRGRARVLRGARRARTERPDQARRCRAPATPTKAADESGEQQDPAPDDDEAAARPTGRLPG